jgi:aldose sugar dehydrogenase
LGPDDILVLEKNNGIVRGIVNGAMLPEPLLDVSVANKNERGMLGIAVSKNENRTDVFCTILNLEDKMVMMIVLRQPYATREIIRLAIVYTDMI